MTKENNLPPRENNLPPRENNLLSDFEPLWPSTEIELIKYSSNGTNGDHFWLWINNKGDITSVYFENEEEAKQYLNRLFEKGE